MSCVIGYIDNENRKGYMICDSIAINPGDFSYRVSKDMKIFKKNDFLIGFVGCIRIGQNLHYDLQIPEQENEDIDTFIYISFMNAIHECISRTPCTEDEIDSTDILVIYKNRLFRIEGCTQIIELTTKYDSIGCASDYVLGCMYTLDSLVDSKLCTIHKLNMAIEIASNFSASVKKPFNILETNY